MIRAAQPGKAMTVKEMEAAVATRWAFSVCLTYGG
jgi:hypothetical protein